MSIQDAAGPSQAEHVRVNFASLSSSPGLSRGSGHGVPLRLEGMTVSQWRTREGVGWYLGAVLDTHDTPVASTWQDQALA